MCGFIASFPRRADSIDRDSLLSALQRIRRRGPDDEGTWNSEGVSLAHCRLAILDLDHRAAQPMISDCGRYVIVFNGEIYNYLELREKLERIGIKFRTNSDTEVILTLFSKKSEKMLDELRGMFAFVIWDITTKRAFLARDPYGIKPLYIARTADGLLVGSQVRALTATGLVAREPNLRAQAGFWMLGSIPEPHTWYRDVEALPAGHYAWIEEGRVAALHQWQDIGEVWRHADDGSPDLQELEDRVRYALNESVRRHLVSDVPVGLFLSGGIDSGSIAGLMMDNGTQSLQAVTLTYDEFAGKTEDEAPIASEVAKHYGFHHTIRRISREEFLADLPRIIDAMDQPSIDGINTWYASKAAKELGLKVVLSGVGGDELFQGYSAFRQLPRYLKWRRSLQLIPGAGMVPAVIGRFQARRTNNRRWLHLSDWTRTIEGIWWLRRSVCAPEDLPQIMGDDAAEETLRDFSPMEWVRIMTGPLPSEPRLALSQIESMIYLRNQLLRDSDWASMDHSIELRTPLVDAHLLQQCGPLLNAFYRFPKKQLIASAPGRALPESVTNRKKTGFGIPVARWYGLTSRNASNESARLWTQAVAADLHAH